MHPGLHLQVPKSTYTSNNSIPALNSYDTNVQHHAYIIKPWRKLVRSMPLKRNDVKPYNQHPLHMLLSYWITVSSYYAHMRESILWRHAWRHFLAFQSNYVYHALFRTPDLLADDHIDALWYVTCYHTTTVASNQYLYSRDMVYSDFLESERLLSLFTDIYRYVIRPNRLTTVSMYSRKCSEERQRRQFQICLRIFDNDTQNSPPIYAHTSNLALKNSARLKRVPLLMTKTL